MHELGQVRAQYTAIMIELGEARKGIVNLEKENNELIADNEKLFAEKSVVVGQLVQV